jgi:murein DD-endopeptidase MepM/ murein hydrolase activator NlpD
VGSTGDSTAPHDHFEWHPWNGGAVDPYYLLRLSCG